MSTLASLYDGAAHAWAEGFASARLAGKPRDALIACVLDASTSGDGFALAFVADAVEVSRRLDAIICGLSCQIRGVPPPFAIAVRRLEGGAVETEIRALTFVDDASGDRSGAAT